jgi:hypothetical protein
MPAIGVGAADPGESLVQVSAFDTGPGLADPSEPQGDNSCLEWMQKSQEKTGPDLTIQGPACKPSSRSVAFHGRAMVWSSTR